MHGADLSNAFYRLGELAERQAKSDIAIALSRAAALAFDERRVRGSVII